MNMRWIVSFTLITIVFGTIFGLVLSGSNPWTSPAEANRINMETEHQQAMNQLEESLSAAQTDAEIKELQRQQSLLDAQYQHDIQALEQDLAHRDVSFKTWMMILTFLGGALSIAVIIGTFLWTGSKVLASISFDPTPTPKFIPPVRKTIVNLPEREPYDPWNSPAYRRQQRVAAQEEERREREELKALAARMKALTDPAQMSRQAYYKRPLAGD